VAVAGMIVSILSIFGSLNMTPRVFAVVGHRLTMENPPIAAQKREKDLGCAMNMNKRRFGMGAKPS
jgi:hypothetical protein